jgi:hypothetical protein
MELPAKSSLQCRLLVWYVYRASKQPFVHCPSSVHLPPLEGTPDWSLGVIDQCQVHHHFSTPAKTLAPHAPEGLVRHAHVTHR